MTGAIAAFLFLIFWELVDIKKALKEQNQILRGKDVDDEEDDED